MPLRRHNNTWRELSMISTVLPPRWTVDAAKANSNCNASSEPSASPCTNASDTPGRLCSFTFFEHPLVDAEQAFVLPTPAIHLGGGGVGGLLRLNEHFLRFRVNIVEHAKITDTQLPS